MPSITLYGGTYGPRSRLARWLARNDEKPNCVIRGNGNTRVTIPLHLRGARPCISGFTLDAYAETQLILENPQEFVMDGIWINVRDGLGVEICLTDEGFGGTHYGWPYRFEEKALSRATVSSIRDCHVLGWNSRNPVNAAGWRIVDKRVKVTDGFITNLNWFGGHTAVDGQAFSFEGIDIPGARRYANMFFYGHHADCREGKGVHIAHPDYNVAWFGGYPEGRNTVSGYTERYRHFGGA